jgi:hypothetical protein
MSTKSNGASTYSDAASNAVVPDVETVAFCRGYIDHGHCYTGHR